MYILNYQKGNNNIVVSYSQPPVFDYPYIKHKCITSPDSSGSPILLINNQKLICFHSAQVDEYNKGTLIIFPIIEFLRMNNNINICKMNIKEKDKKKR